MTETSGKSLLFVGGGIEAVSGICKARDLGIHVVVSDMNSQAPGILAADAALVVSTYDVAATVAVARRYHQDIRPFDGVMCLATDVPLTVAAVAADLGLPGIPVSVAARAMDKLAMKEKFQNDGVPIPWFSTVTSVKQLREIIAERGLPLVLKPVDSRGSRGVLRLTEDVDLDWAFTESCRHSATDRVMVEAFLSGRQISSESIILDGHAWTFGLADRNYELLERYAPNFIENGGDLPSDLTPKMKQALEELIQNAAISLGVTDGVVKGDIVIENGRPHVIELAARLSGGYFCTHEIPLSTGVDPVLAMIWLSLGFAVNPQTLVPRRQRSVCLRYLFPSPGRVVRCGDCRLARAMEGVEMAEILVSPGDVIHLPNDSNAAAALVLTTGVDRNEAQRRTREALDAIQIITEPI